MTSNFTLLVCWPAQAYATRPGRVGRPTLKGVRRGTSTWLELSFSLTYSSNPPPAYLDQPLISAYDDQQISSGTNHPAHDGLVSID